MLASYNVCKVKMNFTSRLDSTAGTALETSIGHCDTAEGRLDCVRKKYSDEDFNIIAENTRKYRHIIEKYGPKVYSIDNSSMSIILEFIPGKTLSDVVTEEINPWESEGLKVLKVLIKNVHKALDEFTRQAFVTMTRIWVIFWFVTIWR